MIGNICGGVAEQRRNITNPATSVWDVLGWETITYSAGQKIAIPDGSKFGTSIYVIPRYNYTNTSSYPVLDVPLGTATAVDTNNNVWQCLHDQAMVDNGGIDFVSGSGASMLIIYHKVSNRKASLFAWSQVRGTGHTHYWPSIDHPEGSYAVLIAHFGSGSSTYTTNSYLDYTTDTRFEYTPIWTEDKSGQHANGYYKLLTEPYTLTAGSDVHQSSYSSNWMSYCQFLLIGIDFY